MQSYADDWTMFVNVARLCDWHTLPRRLGFTRLHPTQSVGDYNGLFIFGAMINAWFGGRPLIERKNEPDILTELGRCGPIYRNMIQDCFWTAIYRGNVRLAFLTRAAGRLLLPRGRDRLYALIPPQITWRFERYVLGMHLPEVPAPRPSDKLVVEEDEALPHQLAK
jgi:hypothetical protein